jgi:AraC family transcriptional regulator
MNDLDVRIVRLEPIRVVATYGFGESPETIAWDKLKAWIKENGIKPEEHRFFGFNNPSPSPGSPNYGYEQWITVGPEVEAENDIEVKDFEGGQYAVTRCKLPDIGPVWKQLARWRESSKHKYGHHQWLEQCLSDLDAPFEEIVMDIYLPIAE